MEITMESLISASGALTNAILRVVHLLTTFSDGHNMKDVDGI